MSAVTIGCIFKTAVSVEETVARGFIFQPALAYQAVPSSSDDAVEAHSLLAETGKRKLKFVYI
jgi:hypothetical protein